MYSLLWRSFIINYFFATNYTNFTNFLINQATTRHVANMAVNNESNMVEK